MDPCFPHPIFDSSDSSFDWDSSLDDDDDSNKAERENGFGHGDNNHNEKQADTNGGDTNGGDTNGGDTNGGDTDDEGQEVERANVMLTGGCGFIGSHLAEYLLYNNDTVTRLVIVDSMTHGSDPANGCHLFDTVRRDVPDVPDSGAASETTIREGFVCGARYRTLGRLTIVEAEYGNGYLMSHLMDQYAIDVVIHAAGETDVDRSSGNPCRCVQVNVLQTVALLEAARANVCRVEIGACEHPHDRQWPTRPRAQTAHPKRCRRLKRFVYISVDEACRYLAADDHRFSVPPRHREAGRAAPASVNVASKAAAELFVRAYSESFGLPTVVIRFGRVYGPRQSDDSALSRIIHLAMQNAPVTSCHNDDDSESKDNGGPTHNWIHVLDVLSAIWAVTRRGRIGQEYNVTSSAHLSVRDIARYVTTHVSTHVTTHVSAQWHGRAVARTSVPSGTSRSDAKQRMAGDACANHLSSPICKAPIHWTPIVPIEEGIANTVAWYVGRSDEDASARGPSSTSTSVCPRALVYEHTCWLGAQVLCPLVEHDTCPEVFHATASQGNADAEESVRAEIDRTRPTNVIMPMDVWPHVDLTRSVDAPATCRVHAPQEHLSDSKACSDGPSCVHLALARLCQQRGIHLTYLCVDRDSFTHPFHSSSSSSPSCSSSCSSSCSLTFPSCSSSLLSMPDLLAQESTCSFCQTSSPPLATTDCRADSNFSRCSAEQPPPVCSTHLTSPRSTKEGSADEEPFQATTLLAVGSLHTTTRTKTTTRTTTTTPATATTVHPLPTITSRLHEEDVKPEDVNPEDVKPEDVKPEDVKPEDVKPEDVKPEDVKPEDVKPEDVKPEDVKPEDVKPDDVKPDDVKPDDVKPDDVPGPHLHAIRHTVDEVPSGSSRTFHLDCCDLSPSHQVDANPAVIRGVCHRTCEWHASQRTAQDWPCCCRCLDDSERALQVSFHPGIKVFLDREMTCLNRQDGTGTPHSCGCLRASDRFRSTQPGKEAMRAVGHLEQSATFGHAGSAPNPAVLVARVHMPRTNLMERTTPQNADADAHVSSDRTDHFAKSEAVLKRFISFALDLALVHRASGTIHFLHSDTVPSNDTPSSLSS